MSHIPKNLRYTKDHEWALKKEDIIVVGITEHAQHQLGDIVFIELPAIGSKIEKEKQFGTVESVKAVSELYSPVTGEIVKINETLKETPDIINKDSYDQGWMIHIKLTHQKEWDELLSPEQYKKLTE